MSGIQWDKFTDRKSENALAHYDELTGYTWVVWHGIDGWYWYVVDLQSNLQTGYNGPFKTCEAAVNSCELFHTPTNKQLSLFPEEKKP